MKKIIIVSCDEGNVIGQDGFIPWHIAEDMVRFKELINGHPIIMGYNAYQALGGPIPGSFNIVCSRREGFIPERPAEVVPSLEDAFDLAESRGYHEAYLIGGSSIFQEALDKDYVDEIRMTLVHDNFEGDSYFPDLKTYDEGTRYILFYQEPGEEYSFLDYIKNPFF